MPATRAEDLLLAFYTGEGRDVQGRTHAQILAWSDSALEAVHDYIQWLFPLPEPSGANPLAPVLTPSTIEALRCSSVAQGRLRASLVRMLGFYGFTLKPTGSIATGPSFPNRTRNWLTPGNHNHLRLTRMLRCLHILGLEQESAALFAALRNIYEKQAPGHGQITPETFRYWQHATE
jgi:hypothetical protein